jgi:Predicted small integral membrane protein (DUF2165)
MIEARIVNVIMVGCLALFALLVMFDNLIDYDTNYTFVRQVLTMDTTLPGNALLYRRITSPAFWRAGYALIIAGEGLTGAVFTVAAVVLGRRLRSDAAAFNRAKRFVYGRRAGFPRVVLRLHGRRRRMVSDVAIGGVERPRGGVSLLHHHSCCAHLRQSAGR